MAMAGSRRIMLVHEGFLIASWSSKFQSVSLREAKIHVQSLFEPGSYNIRIAGEELVDYVMVDTHASVALTIVPTSLRVSVTLRNMSGEQLMDWPACAPYHRIGDLGIPGIRKSYTILKLRQILDDHHRIWLEDEPHAMELTIFVIRESYFVFHLYMHVGGPGEYTAFLLSGFSVPVPASADKIKLRVGMCLLYVQLLETGGAFEKHVVAMLRAGIMVKGVLRRDLLPFAVSTKQDSHLGHVRAIAMLDDDQRFVIRLKTEMFVLEDTPTKAQERAIKEMLLEIPP